MSKYKVGDVLLVAMVGRLPRLPQAAATAARSAGGHQRGRGPDAVRDQ